MGSNVTSGQPGSPPDLPPRASKRARNEDSAREDAYPDNGETGGQVNAEPCRSEGDQGTSYADPTGRSPCRSQKFAPRDRNDVVAGPAERGSRSGLVLRPRRPSPREAALSIFDDSAVVGVQDVNQRSDVVGTSSRLIVSVPRGYHHTFSGERRYQPQPKSGPSVNQCPPWVRQPPWPVGVGCGCHRGSIDGSVHSIWDHLIRRSGQVVHSRLPVVVTSGNIP
jgi:hypothetical protein